ncbi:MAG: hypothetical protein LWX07_13715, partial [Bacteroidetes bacterium]|nr:hypothetical protein [Bacteroidota bacterium]
YAGFGPSAHSFSGGKRWNNVPSVTKYIHKLNDGILPRENIEVQTPDKLETDYFICTLRSKGVGIEEFNGMFKKDFMKSFDKQIKDCIREGSAVIENGRFRLTEKGFALADSITLEFLK